MEEGFFEIEIRDDLIPVERQILEALNRVLFELHTLKCEVRKLAKNDAALTQVVADLAQAYTEDFNALEAQIAALAVAQQNDDDAAQDAAVASLQALVVTMKANTVAANAAVAVLQTPPDTSTATAGDSSAAPAS